MVAAHGWQSNRNFQLTLMDRCGHSGQSQHRVPASTASSAVRKCVRCYECDGDGYSFQVRDTVPALCMWGLLGEPRPVCNASR